MNDIQWLCKWLSERRPEYKSVCKWMYEREEERKTEDSLDAKETLDAVMIVGGRGGGFDLIFGLKENFPEQDEKVLGKAEDAKPVQEENDLIEEAKRNIESCMNLLDTNECQLERAMDAIKEALMDIEDQKCELVVMLSKLDDTLRKLK